MGKKLLSSREAAAYVGISYSYLRVIRMTGQIGERVAPPPQVNIGRRVYYLREDLDAWVLQHRTGAAMEVMV